MRFWTALGYFVAVVGLSAALAQDASTKNITQAEIKNVINESSDCDDLDQIVIDHLEYFDLFGDGRKQAVVVASTCMTGTAGPDIHAVYARDSSGKIVEHSLDRLAPASGRDSQKLPVFGNPNYGIAVENGQLVARWVDSSGRENPLIIWYKWNGKDFAVDHMKAEGPFMTSYDCGKATKEIDRAICYSPEIAALDLQLNQIYRAAMKQQTDKEVLREQQLQWLTKRKKECVIYKWWVDCLTDMYSKRITELKQRAAVNTGP